MNFNLAENTNKLILLVVAAVALLLTLNTYQKQVGKNLAVVLSIVTIVVVGFVGFNLMNEKPVRVNNNVNLVPPSNNMNMDMNMDVNIDNSFDEFELDNTENVSNNVSNNEVNVPDFEIDEESYEDDVFEGFENGNENNVDVEVAEVVNNGNNVENNNGNNNGNNANHPVNTNNHFNCKELLPADVNSTWAQVNPSGTGDLCTKNLLNAGHFIGVNTQGCSLRNANRGLRSEPPNPQVQVSPWLQTTICPDLLRRPLE